MRKSRDKAAGISSFVFIFHGGGRRMITLVVDLLIVVTLAKLTILLLFSLTKLVYLSCVTLLIYSCRFDLSFLSSFSKY